MHQICDSSNCLVLYFNTACIFCHFAVLMSQKQSSILDAPAKKFFACQLSQCTSNVKAAADQWMYIDSSRKICFSQVWVQGIVVLVADDGDDLFLDDGTGIIQANGITRIVKDLFIQKGGYIFFFNFWVFIWSWEPETTSPWDNFIECLYNYENGFPIHVGRLKVDPVRLS